MVTLAKIPFIVGKPTGPVKQTIMIQKLGNLAGSQWDSLYLLLKFD